MNPGVSSSILGSHDANGRARAPVKHPLPSFARIALVTLALWGTGFASSASASVRKAWAQAAHAAKASEVDLRKQDSNYADPTAPNISGFWLPDPDTPLERYTLLDGTRVEPRKNWPYTPKWAAAYARRRGSEDRGEPFGDPTAACWPTGLVRAYVAAAGPIEITQTPGRVQMVFEKFSQVRWLETDGISHAQDTEPTLLGDSVAHWEGKTLVVETTNLRRETTLNNQGTLHSDQLKVSEHIRRIDPITIEIETTLTDSVAMTKSVRNQIVYKLQLNESMSEEICDENNREQPDENLILRQSGARKQYGFDLPN